MTNLPQSLLETVNHVVVGGIKTACLSRLELTDLMVKDCLSRRNSDGAPAGAQTPTT